MAATPLSGVRVLDLTNVLAGPFACHQLAHMGADVINVEARNGGDLAHQLGADDRHPRPGPGNMSSTGTRTHAEHKGPAPSEYLWNCDRPARRPLPADPAHPTPPGDTP